VNRDLPSAPQGSAPWDTSEPPQSHRRGASEEPRGNLGSASENPPRSLGHEISEDRARLERALELAERGRGTTHPNPVVGAVLVRSGEIVGEGWHEYAGGPHAEVVALERAGERARGATAFVTLEPCSHHGRTPPCADALIGAGIARVVVGSTDPTPGRVGLERLREAGVDVALADGELAFRARQQNEAWRVWAAQGRPFVTYKVAVALDGRVVVPGSRWVSGEESRRLVHELRAASDAVAAGTGTVLADAPLLTAREVDAARQPRRIAFGRGPLPDESELELRSGPLEEELAALGSEGVQSLLLEGGPTLATGFLRSGLVDKLLVFVAPVLSGAGPRFLGDLEQPIALQRLQSRAVGSDVLLSAYIHDP
jgi:diaminohydroxyphosphoribosylaminopyrimidine deaminase/5-amino-6-(5-phosphoribosylamino)uracil reductase